MGEPEVLIVGAGPTGLTLACDLARRGVSVRVIDASDRPFPGSRAKGVQPRSLEVLDDLGVVGRLVARGRSRMRVRVHNGSHAGEQDLHAGAGPSPSTPYGRTLLVPQRRVEEVLLERLAEHGVEVRRSTRLVSLAQGAEGVAATVDGPEAEREITARYLVGCDGGSSAVREQLGIGFRGETHESTRMFVADVRLDGLDRDNWHVWQDERPEMAGAGMLALCPLPASDAFQLQHPIPPGDSGEVSLERLQEAVERVTGRADIRLRAASWMSTWRLNVRMAETYRSGRVLLAGDAAHVHSPAGAQGMNTGIQDAYNLGWKLGRLLAGGPEELLDSYEKERLPVAERVLGLSSELTSEGVIGRGNRAREGDTETLQLGLHYRDSSLSGGDSPVEGVLSAGDRAPDAPLRSGSGGHSRLFDLFRGSQWTVLVFGARYAPLAERIAATWADELRARVIIGPEESSSCDGTAFVDWEGHARDAYDVGDSALVVVRPDGYVAVRADHPSEAAIFAHLRGILGQATS